MKAWPRSFWNQEDSVAGCQPTDPPAWVEKLRDLESPEAQQRPSLPIRQSGNDLVSGAGGYP